jgi:hypothetical protein
MLDAILTVASVAMRNETRVGESRRLGMPVKAAKATDNICTPLAGQIETAGYSNNCRLSSNL